MANRLLFQHISAYQLSQSNSTPVSVRIETEASFDSASQSSGEARLLHHMDGDLFRIYFGFLSRDISYKPTLDSGR